MAKPPASSGSGANDPGASGERTALPTRQEVLTYLAEAPGKLGKRELARAFGIKGDARAAFKDMLRDMAAEGMIAGNRKEFHRPGKLPARIVVDVIGTDDEGDLIARPANPAILDNGMPPLIRLVDDTRRRGEPAVGVGDGLLIKPAPHQGDGMRFRGREVTHSGAIIRRLERDDRSLLGIFRHNTGRATPTHAASIEPVEKKNFRAVSVRPGDDLGAADGDLVRYQMALKRGAGYQSGRVVEVLGNPDDQRQLSLIAIHAHGLRNEFSPELRAELDHLPAVDAASRVDLTELALITIDPPDARDHDDAVHAIADTDPGNPGGHILTVAIADVAHYVRPGTLLDQEALARGNSVYFPDRVVPMLPEKISNDLCSLREGEVRPCLAVRMVFDASGTKRTHRFMRAIMRSHAKLSYDEAQAAIDAGPLIEGDTSERAKSPIAAPDKAIALRDTILAPLWRAYFALAHARRQRGPLELDLPERKIIMDDKGGVADIHVPQRLDAHRLIEECMIQANVAAAETLESARQQLVYRCHEGPSKEKHIALRDFLETIDL
ncbi:MAG: RNB domain-containing ribonuclease, partial [Pseudomonadota bacterium]